MTQVELQGRVAVVTGGTSGIGKATAFRLANAGARVFVGDILPRTEALDGFAHRGIEFIECDVRDLGQLERLIVRADQLGGRLDILVNNAGVNLVKQCPDVTEDEWDRCLDTNLKAAFFGCKFAVPRMIRGGGGAIVNTASNAGLLPRAHDPVYSISKQALVGLTRSLALCHSKDRIRVNCVCPGPVGETEMMESELAAYPDRTQAVRKYIHASPLARALDRMIRPDEVADAILYLVSEAAAMVTGTAIAIDGGKSLGVPPAVD